MSNETYDQQLLTITHVVRPWQVAIRNDKPSSESLLEKYEQLQERASAAMKKVDSVKLVREQRD